MKYIIVFFVLLTNICFSQIVFKVETDKSVYEYGETIKLTVTLENSTDETVEVKLGNYNVLFVEVDSVLGTSSVIEMNSQDKFNPYEKKEWIYNIEPLKTGIPRWDGEHTIIASCASFKDSVVIQAPKIYGGPVRVDFNSEFRDEFDKLKDSLKVNVKWRHQVSSQSILERWLIDGYCIDSLETAFKNDDRFNSFRTIREIYFPEYHLYNAIEELNLPNSFDLKQNYPNPFNPETTIEFDLAETENVNLSVYDLTGQQIKTIVDKELAPGNYLFKFEAGDLSSGIYIYKLRTKNSSVSKKMILLK